jgi:hypothetical protein
MSLENVMQPEMVSTLAPRDSRFAWPAGTPGWGFVGLAITTETGAGTEFVAGSTEFSQLALQFLEGGLEFVESWFQAVPLLLRQFVRHREPPFCESVCW